jgi:protein-S-isoprenylcysteine O-methyltransferase Ste14
LEIANRIAGSTVIDFWCKTLVLKRKRNYFGNRLVLKMKPVIKKAITGFLQLFIMLLLLLFLPAWTFHYWQAWVFLAVFFIPALVITIYLGKNDLSLLQRRVDAGPREEKRRSQKIIQAIAQLAFFCIIVIPAVDHRLGWSVVPVYAVGIGDVLVLSGFYIVFLVFKENTFTSAIIEVAKDQTVISTGLYGIVRHPMYMGALVLLFGIPPALGSWWGPLFVIPMIAVLAWRLLDEEKFLAADLKGYSEYQLKVKYRLLPFIW